jgi:peptidoglycan hydrolase-like protein with peptidoglycan-binding domain
VSTPVPQSTQICTDVGETSTSPSRPRRWRLIWTAVGVVVVAGVSIAVANPFGGGPSSSGVVDNSYPVSVTHVRLGSLSAQVVGLGSLTYAAQPDGSPYAVVNRARGTITSLPATGQVIKQGQVLYEVSNSPVILMNGSTPVYRSLSAGDRGPDVRELNADLVAMGYATRSALNPSSDYFGPATASALARMQGALGVSGTGTLPLGQVVFLPAPLRITQVNATLGGNADAGGTVLHATSTVRQVQVNIDATQQSSLKVGDPVLITLPNYQDTPGVVSSVGTVASWSNSSTPTIPVDIALEHPQDAGSLDQAPVRVQISTAGVSNALIVPVTALVPQNGGGYAVETVDARGIHHLVPVTLGLFDDADGLVQVMSQHLSAGQPIVVPAT